MDEKRVESDLLGFRATIDSLLNLCSDARRAELRSAALSEKLAQARVLAEALRQEAKRAQIPPIGPSFFGAVEKLTTFLLKE